MCRLRPQINAFMEVSELKKSETGLFGALAQLGHEQVVFCYDEPTGLKAIIGIHNTALGPALGGTRMWNYATEQEALTDVLRLSRGMTFKAAITGLNLGGGKAVIIGDAKTQKTEAFLRRFGKFINSLGGKYITAEDVNMKTADMEYIAMETRYVTGLPESMGGGGDPSPVTAYGTYLGIKASAKKVFGNDSLTNRKIAVQGVGQVGMHLVEYLVKENAQVFITDISEEKVKDLTLRFKVTPVNQESIYDLDVDVYAPCALGATLNDNTIPFKMQHSSRSCQQPAKRRNTPRLHAAGPRHYLCTRFSDKCRGFNKRVQRIPWTLQPQTGIRTGRTNIRHLPEHT